jgi:hypothetical protein
MKQKDSAAGEEIENVRVQPDSKRIKYVRSDRWINYAAAQDAIARLTDLLTYPPRDRMPCLLIYGPTGIGKTKVIRKFLRDHPAVFDRATGGTSIPVVAFQMPPQPDQYDFWDELYRALGAPASVSQTVMKTRNLCRGLLETAGTRMLIVDEVHSMLAGTARDQRVFLNTLRFIANDIRIPLVCAGTDEARLALLTDSQLAERFDALELPRWTNDKDFRRLLVSISGTLPLRKDSLLDSEACREVILRRTDGITTRIFRLIESAAIQAISDGTECITEESLASRNLILPLVSMTRKIQRQVA